MDRICKQEEQFFDDGSLFTSNLSLSPKFFKIVANPQDDKLRIPTGFIRKYGRNLPDEVTLKAPGGSVRMVKLVKIDGHTCFHEGWEEFRDYYSICLGYVLLFQYDGKSHFDVFIFDTTTLEIQYPLDNADEEDEGVIESEPDDSAVILKKVCETRKGKQKRNSGKDKCRSKKKTTTIMDKERCEAYQLAKGFKSNNPFCICVMQPSYVTSRVDLFVPYRFAWENLPNLENKLRLRVKGQGTWSMKCTLIPRKSGRSVPKARIAVGWKKFVRDNALMVGDVCVFEVNKRENLLWNVTIFRGQEKVVNASESEDPVLISKDVCIVLKEKGKRNYEECHEMRRIMDKESCRTYKKAKALVFDSADGKDEGMTGTELEDSAVILEEVYASIKGKPKRNSSKDQCRSKKKTTTIMDKESCEAYQMAKGFKSNNPFCICVMQPSYVTSEADLFVPARFARENLLNKENKLRLRVKGKGTWSAICTLSRGRARMTSGWGNFVRDNAIMVGDVCVFEVNKLDNLLWDITIFRG